MTLTAAYKKVSAKTLRFLREKHCIKQIGFIWRHVYTRMTYKGGQNVVGKPVAAGLWYERSESPFFDLAAF